MDSVEPESRNWEWLQDLEVDTAQHGEVTQGDVEVTDRQGVHDSLPRSWADARISQMVGSTASTTSARP